MKENNLSKVVQEFEEMIEEGLCPDQVSDEEMHEAFTEIFDFCVKSLEYHYL